MSFEQDLPIPGADKKYLAINLIARRAKDLAGKRAKPTIHYSEDAFDPMDLAAEELQKRNLKLVVRDELSGEVSDFEGTE